MEAGRVGRVATAGALVRTGAGLLSLGAGVIHAVVMGEHFREFWVFGAFFVAVAAAQAAWAALVMVRPSRAVLVGGAVLNLAVAAIWAISRIAGMPVGPDAGVPEAVGPLDLMATSEEVVVVLAVLALLASPAVLRRPVRDGVPVVAIGSLAMLVAGITAAAVVSWRQGDIAPPGGTGPTEGHGLHLIIVGGALVVFAVRALLVSRRSGMPSPRSPDKPGDDPAP